LISLLGLLELQETPFSIAGRINFLRKYNASNEKEELFWCQGDGGPTGEKTDSGQNTSPF
jgi:hypothetical protein